MTGSGTPTNPYIIMDLDDLDDIRNDLDAYYELGADIDASPTESWDSGQGWTPIGQSSPWFSGHIDGRGHTIDGLYINRDETLIGFIGSTDGTGGVIRNLHLTNAVIIHPASIVSWAYIGILCGWASTDSLWEDCSVTGTITIQGAISTGADVGGAFGWLWRCSARRCWSNVAIISAGDDDDIGGFAGEIYGCSSRSPYNNEVSRCFSLGSITKTVAAGAGVFGGFAGQVDWGATDPQDSDINNCFARVLLTSYQSGDWDSGGFIGNHGGDTVYDTLLSYCYAASQFSPARDIAGGFMQTSNDNYRTITACYWDMDLSGQATSDGGTGKTTEQMKNIGTFSGGGYTIPGIWDIFSYCNGGYPCLVGVQSGCEAIALGKDYTLAPTKVTLEAIRNLEIVYGGRFLVDRTGKAKYESRYARNA